MGLGDVTAEGRARLDALARYLQDVAAEDVEDAGLDEPVAWIVRRCAFWTPAAGGYPTLGERLTITTFCSGLGSRWAERRTSVVGHGGSRVEATALWVCTAAATGRPVALSPAFLDVYAGAAAGRVVSARLGHGDPPLGSPGLERRRWPLRATDLDVLGHVNNAVHWQVVEDELRRTGECAPGPAWAELEYRGPMGLGDDVAMLSLVLGGAGAQPGRRRPVGEPTATEPGRPEGEPGRLDLWLVAGDAVRASAQVVPGAA